MSEKVKMYQVETQKDYDDLMIELEQQGYKWMSGDKPTTKAHYWDKQRENTVIVLDDFDKYRITRGSMSWCKGFYSSTPIIKHKAKGVEQMEKVVVPKFVAEYIENHYGTKPDVWDKADLIRDFDMYLECYGNPSLQKWVKNDDNFLTLITAIITNDYEVEEEKKYYWRKKKEYSCNFEHHRSNNYLNLDGDGRLFFSDKAEISLCTTKFTETKLRELVSEEDLNKLERVEIDDVQ